MKDNPVSPIRHIIIACVLSGIFLMVGNYILPLESISRSMLVPHDTVRLSWGVIILSVAYLFAFLSLQFKGISYSLLFNCFLFIGYLTTQRNKIVLVEHFTILRNAYLLFIVVIFVLTGLAIILRKVMPADAQEGLKIIPKATVFTLIISIFSFAIAVFIIGPLLNVVGM